MMAFQRAWPTWTRKSFESGADLWLIAAETQTRMSACHGQAVAALVNNWPEVGALQPQKLPAVIAGFVDRSIRYQEAVHGVLAGSQRALVGSALRMQGQLTPEQIEAVVSRWPAPSSLIADLLRTSARAWKRSEEPVEA